MVEFEFHDEGGYVAAELFLANWLPAAAVRLAQLLGPAKAHSKVHVVLSSLAVHARRFPTDPRPLQFLVDDDQAAELPGGLEGLAQAFPPSTYAHGVATLASLALQLPSTIELGDATICLDVETIQELADSLEVSVEGLLARTSLHELSHIFRGHAREGQGATHGSIREGDAQRDAWQILEDVMVDPSFAALARAGRAAQVRLASRQPAAYRRFGEASPDRHSWMGMLPEDRRTWLVRPRRELLPLTKKSVIELVLRESDRGGRVPYIGDHVYLEGHGILVGPWVMIGRASVPRQPNMQENTAIERLSKESQDSGRYVWPQLRPSAELMATRNIPDGLTFPLWLELQPQALAGTALNVLTQALRPAEPILDELAERLSRDHDEAVSDALALLGREHPGVLDSMRYDPFEEQP